MNDSGMNEKLLHGLEFSLTIGCKLNCDYCPQELLLEKYYGKDKNRERKLSFNHFKIALDKVQKGATISFSGMSEPFHNEECADMIVYAYEKGYKICINTTLIGMTITDFEKIKDIKFESFILHIPDKDNHAKFIISDEYLELLKLVNKNIKIDYYSCHGTVHEAVKNIIDREKYAGIHIMNRAGNLDVGGREDALKDGKIICNHGSEEQISGWLPVMLPDGSLVLCCQDYGIKHILGNLIFQSWNEILEGDEYRRFRDGLNDDSIDILCRKCSEAIKVENLPSMKLLEYVKKVKNRGGVNADFPREVKELIERLATAENICVFGLGKLWRDHYYQEYWDEGLGTTLFADNNPKLHGTNINGIKCVNPSELNRYDNLIVVIFVKNSDEIISQLAGLGIDNCISINEVYSIGNFLCEQNLRKMTREKNLCN